MRLGWLLAAALLFPQGVAAQLAERVGAVDDGSVVFRYPIRDGVEVCDQGVRIGHSLD